MHKQHILPLIILSLLSILALTNLSAFPIFADEAIYLFWARKIFLGMANPFVSMYDGKPPLFMWLTVAGQLLNGNLLLIGRVVSVTAFLGGLIGLYQLLKKEKFLAISSVILIALSPFVFFHSRLAILDSLFSVFLLLAVLTWTQLKNRSQIIFTGVFLGLAFWTKTPAIFLFPFPFLSALLIKRSRKEMLGAILTTGIAVIISGLLKFSVWFPFLFNRTSDFTYPILSILHGQISQIGPNFLSLINWLIGYRLWPRMILAIFSVVLSLIKKQKLVLNLTLASLLFTLPFIIFGKVLSPRYYLFLGFTLPIIATYILSKIPRTPAYTFLGLTILYYAQFVFILLTNPLAVKLPKLDQHQYLMDWSSGIGIRQAAEFFITQSQKGKVKVLSEGYFGTLPDGLFVQLGDKIGANIEIVGVGDNASANFKKEVANSKADFLYYIGNHDRLDLYDRPDMELILSYPKVDQGPALEIYRIKK